MNGKCDLCEKENPRVLCNVEAISKTFEFCNLFCKAEYFKQQYVKLMSVSLEEKDETVMEKQANSMRKVRVFVANKGKDGRITVMRR